MELAEALRILRRRWPVVVASVLVAAGTAWFTAPAPAEVGPPRRVTEYTASQMLVRSTDSPTSSSEVSLPLLARLAEMGDVPAAVIERLDLEVTPDVLAARVQVEVDSGLAMITISSLGTDQEKVTTLVDAYADELMRFAAERNASLRDDALERVRRLVAQQQGRVRELNAELQGLPTDSIEWLLVRAERDALVTTYGKNLQTMEELVSQPPSDPGVTRLGEVIAIPTSTSVFAPPPTKRLPRALGGGTLGVLLGLGLAFVVDRSDRRLHTRDQLEAVYAVPVLAEIDLPTGPAEPAAILDVPVDDEAMQAFTRLGMAVLHRISDAHAGYPESPTATGSGRRNGSTSPKVVLVTSAGSAEGRTTALAHLAGAMAATGYRVVVTATGDHWAEASAALSTTATGRAGLLDTALPGVYVSADKLSSRPDLEAIHGERLSGFDLVLVDAGPIFGSGDAAALLHGVDGVLLVARAVCSRRDAAERARDYLDQVGESSAGVLLLRFRRHLPRRAGASTALDVYRRRASGALRRGAVPTVAGPPSTASFGSRGFRKR
ncbi:MAG: hypothetical protein KY462_12040 [Actinobacteria bacterium]|nr:hypothetical protein [Actinomycetota bacterium]